MANVIIEGISVGYQAFGIMSGLFHEKWAANRVQKYMTAIGMGYRRSTVQSVRRHVLDVVKKQRFTDKLGEMERPKKGHLVEMTWDDPHNYKTQMQALYFNPETGLEEIGFSTYWGNNLPTKFTASSQLKEDIILGDSKEGMTLVKMISYQFNHRKGAPY